MQLQWKVSACGEHGVLPSGPSTPCKPRGEHRALPSGPSTIPCKPHLRPGPEATGGKRAFAGVPRGSGTPEERQGAPDCLQHL